MLAAFAGCDAGPGTGGQPADDEVALRAESSYGRHAAVRGKVDIRIANDSDQQVEVVAWQVRHPLFEVVPPTDRPSSVPPDGRERIVPVPFGAARCEDDRDVATDPVVVLTVLAGSGQRRVTVPLDDGPTGLVRAHRLTCAAEAVTDAVDLRIDSGRVDGSGADAVLRTALLLTRAGPGAAEVTDVRGNVLLSVEPPATDPLGSLTGDEEQEAVPLVVRATRCEAHALTESKTTSTFPVYVSLDGAEPTSIQVTTTGAATQALQALLTTTCGPAFSAS